MNEQNKHEDVVNEQTAAQTAASEAENQKTETQSEPEIEVEVKNAEDQKEAQKENQEAQSEPTQEQWRAALEMAVKQRDEYLALAQRAQADYHNFKRRNQQTRTEAYDDGTRETITAMLPVLDNLERAIAAAEGESEALLAGVKMVYKHMLDSLIKLGLEEVPALGEQFDPDIHNAVMKASEGEPGTVLEVFQKGYRVKGRMIRYAMVKIAADD